MENYSDALPVNIDLPSDRKVRITWDAKIRPDFKVRAGDCLGTYVEASNPDSPIYKIKAPIAGKIAFLEPAEQEISPLQICGIEKCRHDVQIGKLCSSCGALVNDSQNDHVGFLNKELTLSRQKSKEVVGDLEIQTLSEEKLVLMLDLDNTLIHAESLRHNSKEVELKFNPEQDGLTFVEFNQDRFIVKLRPFLQEFLANLSEKYIIYVYTKGTREYAEQILRKVDLGGIYVSKERILSESELGANQFRSVNQVIHEGSLAMILDDRVDVWGSTKNLIFTEPYHVFDSVQGKLVITKKVDAFLFMIRDVLDVIHEIFYLFFSRGDRIKIGDIYHTIRQNLFAKERVAFYGIFHSEEELLKSEEYKQLRSLGVSAISLEPTIETTLIFSKVCNRIKQYPVSEAPVVSLWYIYYCELYCTHLNPDDFDLRKVDTVIQVLEKNTHKSLEEKNLAKEEMENYLRLNRSNEGGHEIIRDIVIRKLEERKDEKGNFREDEEFDVVTKKVKMERNGEVQVHLREVNFNIVEREEDHKIKDLNRDGGDNQEVLDKEVNLVQHYLNE